MRLVDADALKEWGEVVPLTDDGGIDINDFEERLVSMPTIEAEPVKHGRWIIRDNPGTGWYRVTCSECGEDVTSTVPVIGFFPNAKVVWDYCPYCGARMDEAGK